MYSITVANLILLLEPIYFTAIVNLLDYRNRLTLLQCLTHSDTVAKLLDNRNRLCRIGSWTSDSTIDRFKLTDPVGMST